uniref:Uncharacterized protein n=1 Tax=Panagrolaimus davidi TaxID=227884 RepID=A0A914QY37_9BILA
MKEKEGSDQIYMTSTHVIQYPFEFPRQQNDKVFEPEASQYKASQRLINPDQNAITNMTPKKAPPLVYHSNQLKGLNGVDDMQDKYLYNAAIKMDEQIEYFVSTYIERLSRILHELKNDEHGEKQTSNLIVGMLNQLVEGTVLENKKMNKKIKFGRNLQVYNSFADSTKLIQSYHTSFTNAQKVLGEYLLDADLLLLLSTKIAYSIFRHCNNSADIKLPRLSNPPSTSQAFNISLCDEALQAALNSILDYSLNLHSVRERFSKMFIAKVESQRLKLCDSNMKLVLHRRKKHLKSAKLNLNETKNSSHDDSVELYKLATSIKKDDKCKPVRVTAVEISTIQESIKIGRAVCDKKKVSIGNCFQANKEAILKNSELEFVEKENQKHEAVLKSALYKSQLLLVPKLELEKIYWKSFLSQRLQELKCVIFNAYSQNSEFRRKMIAIIEKFPQCLHQGRLSIENAVAANSELVGQIARKKCARFQSTQKCRSQWSQHYDVMEVALNDASVNEKVGLALKEAMCEKVY